MSYTMAVYKNDQNRDKADDTVSRKRLWQWMVYVFRTRTGRLPDPICVGPKDWTL